MKDNAVYKSEHKSMDIAVPSPRTNNKEQYLVDRLILGGTKGMH